MWAWDRSLSVGVLGSVTILAIAKAPAASVEIVSVAMASFLVTSARSVFFGGVLDLQTDLKWSCLPHFRHFFPNARHSFSRLARSEL